MGKEFWKGCTKNGHVEWDDDCIQCRMNKDVYENYEMYQAMGEV